MATELDDQVHLMDAQWFMSYPHDVYARLRREAPVYWSSRDELWAISKYEDVRWVSKNPQLFANGYHVYVTAAGVKGDGLANDAGSKMPRRAELRRIDALGPRSGAIAALVERDDAEAGGDGCVDQRAPHRRGLREAVQKDESGAAVFEPGDPGAESQTIGFDPDEFSADGRRGLREER